MGAAFCRAGAERQRTSRRTNVGCRFALPDFQGNLIAGRTVGGYAWARMGWRPTMESWESLKGQIRERLKTHVLMLTERERKVIDSAIQRDDPRMIWRLADLNRVIEKDGHEDMSIGKVLLLGTAWVG